MSLKWKWVYTTRKESCLEVAFGRENANTASQLCDKWGLEEPGGSMGVMFRKMGEAFQQRNSPAMWLWASYFIF